MSINNKDVDNTLSMMYSEICVDNELNERLNILQMMYSTVQPLNSEVIYCAQEDEVTLVNRYGVELARGTKDTIRKAGCFIAMLDKDNTTSIYCFSTGASKKIKNSNNRHHYFSMKEAGTEYVVIEYMARSVILDRYLNNVFDVETSRLKVYVSDSKICVKHRIDMFRESTGYINRLTGKVEFYDYFDLDDTYRCIATEYHRDKGLTVNKDCIQYLKYKLTKNGSIVSSRSYEDITKPSELRTTNTFFTFDLGGKYRRDTKLGLLRDDGVELLEPVYDSIRYIGANNYLVDIIKDNIINSVRYSAIYNSDTGVVYNFNEVVSAEMHKTLPLLVLIKADGGVKLITTSGIEMEPAEIAKYFKCSYSEQRPDIIRIELDYGKKYITNTLVPITNLHEISRLSTHNWIPMCSD